MSPPHYGDVPRFRDEKPMFGPRMDNGQISVKYPSQIDGYGQDDAELSKMELLGLPTGFSFNRQGNMTSLKQKKGEKKTFYCNICLIELNSLDTMKSHIEGVREKPGNSLS